MHADSTFLSTLGTAAGLAQNGTKRKKMGA